MADTEGPSITNRDAPPDSGAVLSESNEPTADAPVIKKTRLVTEYLGVDLDKGVRLITHKHGISFQADLRAYKDVLANTRPVLCEPGTKTPVRCPKRANELYRERLKELEEARKRAGLSELEYDPKIGPAARAYLIAKAEANNHAPSTLDAEAGPLIRFVEEFRNCRVSEITALHLEKYVTKRQTEPGVRKGTLTQRRTIRNELHALSGLYTRLKQWRLIGYNPVPDVTNKPNDRGADEMTWLYPDEGGQLLDAAARIDAETRQAKELVAVYKDECARGAHTCRLPRSVHDTARRFAHCEVVLALFIYTGGRLMEVLGLDVADIDFKNGWVSFRPNGHRGLKKRHHKRNVKLWRPLLDTLLHYLAETGITDGLLVPSVTGEMMKGFSKPFERCLVEAGLITPGRHITRHTLRHTYAMLLFRTLRRRGDRYVERSIYSVMRCLGHCSVRLIERTYGHEINGLPTTTTLSCEAKRTLPARRLRLNNDSATAASTTLKLVA